MTQGVAQREHRPKACETQGAEKRASDRGATQHFLYPSSAVVPFLQLVLPGMGVPEEW